MDMDSIMIICDNQSFMKMTKNLVFHDKRKNRNRVLIHS